MSVDTYANIIAGGGSLYVVEESVAFPSLADVDNKADLTLTNFTSGLLRSYEKTEFDFQAEEKKIRVNGACADSHSVYTGWKGTMTINVHERDLPTLATRLGVAVTTVAAGAAQCGKKTLSLKTIQPTFKRALFVADAPFAGGFDIIKLFKIKAKADAKILFDSEVGAYPIVFEIYDSSEGYIDFEQQTAAPVVTP